MYIKQGVFTLDFLKSPFKLYINIYRHVKHKDMLTYILIGLGFYITIVFAIRHVKDFSVITSAWQHSFENMQFSSKAFYASIEEKLKSKEISDISISTQLFHQGDAFSKERTYLRIRRADWMFLICASPFYKDFFVSYRVGEPRSPLKDFVLCIPIIGFLLKHALYRKTYFIEDTDAMFTNAVKDCIKEAIDEMTKTNGVRPLTEFEEQSFLVGTMQQKVYN